VVRVGETRNAYRVLVGETARKRSLGKQRRRFEDNINTIIRETGLWG
jgi:hypothetical protein